MGQVFSIRDPSLATARFGMTFRKRSGRGAGIAVIHATRRRAGLDGGVPCDTKIVMTRCGFERMSKRRRGFPSETHVKRGRRVVGGGAMKKELIEKLGRNDLCPCGSGRRFQEVLHVRRTV